MDLLSDRYLGHKPIPIKPLLGSGKSVITFDRVDMDRATEYAAEDADITLRLWKAFRPRLHRSRVTTVYETLERPMVAVLNRMEMEGITVDRAALFRMSEKFSQEMARLEGKIHELAGGVFNVGSPKQLGEILFDRMGLPGGKRGKTGAYSTPAIVLEDLATEHELPARVLDWRQLAKLKSTYTDSLQEHINADTGRVHTSYSIAGASTGRLASTDPNLQNIPVRTEEGRRIREAFVAAPGKVLVSLDYSQIELRILAHIADIPELKKAFADGLDIHAMTASEMFDVPLDEMTPDIRRQAKAINFGLIYGMSPFGLSRQLGVTRSEAQEYVSHYFARYPGVQQYMERTRQQAHEQGWVETLFGRRLHLPDIRAKDFRRRSYAERSAINAPMQGTAADIIKRAMIRIHEWLAPRSGRGRLIMQVHDELVFECDADFAGQLAEEVTRMMAGAASLEVPLKVDVGQGPNWDAAH